MNTNDSAALEQQRQRRKRVNRIKTGIMITVAVWMLGSLLVMMILGIQVIRLSGQVKHLEKMIQTQSTQQAEISQETQAATENVQEQTQPTTAALSQVITGMDTEDNLARKGDTHEVYLTFDGGPDANTDKILDILQQYGVKATFFVVGNDSEDMKAVYKRIVEDGNTLGMHSYSNQFSQIYASTEAFEEDFDKLSSYLKELTGTDSLYYRFPGGSSNEISNVNMTEFVRVLNQKGITYFDWNVSAGDTSSDYTVEDVVANVTLGVSRYKTSVVLLHDGDDKSTTVEALGPLIEALQKMDAKILPIDKDTKVIQYIKADSVE